MIGDGDNSQIGELKSALREADCPNRNSLSFLGSEACSDGRFVKVTFPENIITYEDAGPCPFCANRAELLGDEK